MRSLLAHFSLFAALVMGFALGLSAQAQTASGEAKTDVLSVVIVGFIVVWFVIGLIGTIRWNKTEIWFWPLFFMMRGPRRGSEDAIRGPNGSFSGGGASGGW
jgi:hypothetical protein